MLSEEIKEYLKIKNYLLTINEYLKLIESPQVRSVKYENNMFHMTTDDNYIFKFKINDY